MTEESKKLGGAHINMPADPLAEHDRMISDTEAICQEAVSILVGQGLTQQDAEQLVERNFHRCNNNPNLIVNLAELCRK